MKKKFLIKSKPENRDKEDNKQRIIILAITLGLMYFLWQERDVISGLSKLGYIGIFLVNFLANSTIVFPLPGAVSSFLAGALWNPLFVGIFSGVGAAFGELFGYFLGYGGRGLVTKYDRESAILIKVEKFVRKNAFASLFFLALIPFPFFDFAGIFAGGISYPVWKFMLATATGRVIRDMLLAFTGARIL